MQVVRLDVVDIKERFLDSLGMTAVSLNDETCYDCFLAYIAS